jgi:hypothetical protein
MISAATDDHDDRIDGSDRDGRGDRSAGARDGIWRNMGFLFEPR